MSRSRLSRLSLKRLAIGGSDDKGDRGLARASSATTACKDFLTSIVTSLRAHRQLLTLPRSKVPEVEREASEAELCECKAAPVTDDSGSTPQGAGQQLHSNDGADKSSRKYDRPVAEFHDINYSAGNPPVKRITMLLHLPPEILEMILLALPPDSFAVMLMTSKSVRAAIMATQKVLRTQLMKLPGLRPADQLDMGDLLKAFNARAARSAWNGLETFADVVVHAPMLPEYHDQQWSRPKFNWIQPCCPTSKSCDRGLLATAADFRGVIHVYRIRKGRINPLCKLDPRDLELEESDSSCIRFRCEMMRWQRCKGSSHLDYLIGLFSYSITKIGKSGDKFAQQFVTEAEDRASRTYHLIGWKLGEEPNKLWMTAEIQRPLGYRSIILATADDYNKEYMCNPMAVIFEATTRTTKMYKISVLQVTNSKVSHLAVKSETNGVEAPNLTFSQSLTRARFTKGPNADLWLYGYDTAPIDNVTGCITQGLASLRLASTVSTHRTTPKLFTSKASPASFKGIAIKTDHSHECGVYDNGTKYCVQTILELVVPRSDKHKGVFLVKYAEEQETCSPYDLNLELPALEYTVVAKLLGSDQGTSSPLSLMIAISPDRDWIAIAEWDKIKLWGLHTKAFLDPDYGSLPPASKVATSTGITTWKDKQNRALRREFSTIDDKAYTTNCGQGYFHDHIRIKGETRQHIVGIEPIELPSRGVVFSMAFAKRNILWAWTERGLVKWVWNRKRSGVREEVVLARVPDDLWGRS